MIMQDSKMQVSQLQPDKTGIHNSPHKPMLNLKLPISTTVACFVICLWVQKSFLQTVWTQIRLLLYEQSDQGPHCLPVCKNTFEKFARLFGRCHKQTTFSDASFLGMSTICFCGDLRKLGNFWLEKKQTKKKRLIWTYAKFTSECNMAQNILFTLNI